MVSRKGAGYAIELMVSIFVLLAFAAGSFNIPENQDWSSYQEEIAAQDLSYSLKRTGHTTHFLKNSETGSLKTAIQTISARDMQVSGTVSNLPILETVVGYHTLPKRRYPNQELQNTITDCSGDLDELESEVESGVPILQTDPGNSREGLHDVTLYVGDTDPKVSGGFNGNTDYDTVWVDNGTECQFTSDQGPFYLEDFFLWGNTTEDTPDTYYDIKSINSNEIQLYKADQPVEMQKMLSNRVNGIKTQTSVDTLALNNANLSNYDILVFREEESLDDIQNSRTKIEDFMNRGSVLLLMNLQETDTNHPFVEDVGLEWTSLSQGDKTTSCPHTGDVVIDGSNSPCTFGPGKHFMNSLEIQATGQVNINSQPRACENIFRGRGCNETDYAQYSPKLVVEGPVNIEGTINGVGEGFQADSGGPYGPGAGSNGSDAGGGAYGGDGGGPGGGDEYGLSFGADRLGSAGGYDTDGFYGGDGGGSVWIQSESFSLTGQINVDGEDGASDAGGGAGGSVKIQSDEVSGTGDITANGGDSSSSGGGGAGGRVLVKSGSGDNNFNIETAGGSGVSTASGGSVESPPGIPELDNMIAGFTTTVSDEADSYFKGLNGDQRKISLVPGGWIKSGGAETVTSDENFLYTINQRYNSNDWNATSRNMNYLSSRPPGAPQGDLYSEDVLTFPGPACNGNTSCEVVNTCLGNCGSDRIRGLNVDFDEDDDYSDPGEGPFLQSERVVIANRSYRVSFNHSSACNDGRDCAGFVFAGSDEIELINHRTDFEGFQGQRLARAAYEQEFETDDLKTLASTIYWLRGDQLTFSQEDQPEYSTGVVGSVKEEVFMPYKLNLRWSNE
ncbi:hypothetical protein [Candidatus Nanohalovita haloferacivicina]|uniref:hypothetical protein n=1 Tax=Candidatus Nanohalovita haloferacivicina TaxID=2978046 RepID=UPI00325FCBE8|nr:hypothetical protein HBNXNv_0389 [Candidatus Nanohalobia archaeon BNXNv]